MIKQCDIKYTYKRICILNINHIRMYHGLPISTNDNRKKSNIYFCMTSIVILNIDCMFAYACGELFILAAEV